MPVTKKTLNLFHFKSLCAILAVLTFLFVVYFTVARPDEISKAQKLKKILIWNSAHRIETLAFGTGNEAFVDNACPVNECTVHHYQVMPLSWYDAVIVHMHEIYHVEKMPKFKQSAHQRLIFLTQESPTTMPIEITEYNNTFNWTMTYRRNSDVQLLYGRVTPRASAPKSHEEFNRLKAKTPSKNYARHKTKLAAWMVSHCPTNSLRESYVNELKKYADVATYGWCGDLRCERDEANWLSHPSCYHLLESKYKFYLSFENSICTDYATEKFFKILEFDMVPIVYGGANYSEIAPPHSYIDALDFTPETLAEYLKVLDANDTLYNEYFWWKEHYDVESGVEQMARHAFCDLCQKLHQDATVKYYEQLVSEWHPDNQCKQMKSWES